MTALLSENKNFSHLCSLSRYWLCIKVRGEDGKRLLTSRPAPTFWKFHRLERHWSDTFFCCMFLPSPPGGWCPTPRSAGATVFWRLLRIFLRVTPQ